MNCPATIILRDIVFFTGFKVSTVVITIYNFFIFQNYIPKSFFSGLLTDEFIILTI